jgi:thiol-disulfide isomerase/thioredoxin
MKTSVQKILSFPRGRQSNVARLRDKDSCAPQMRRRWIAARAGMTVFRAIIVPLLLSSPTHAADFASHIHPTDPPQKLPAFVFEDDKGVQHALSDYKGRFVLLNFWATWCPPCVQEMPSLDNLQKNMGSPQFAVVPLSEDRGDATIAGFYQSHGLTHLPVAIDNAGTIPYALHLRGLPTSLLINPRGQEIARIEGGVDWNSPAALAFLRAEISATRFP